jgi:carbonic anhydrase
VHVIRNAGGEVTEDTLRSLTISQHELGTTEVMLIHHTQCGMQTFKNKEFKLELQAETGHKPHWATLAFTDVDTDIRRAIARVRDCPFLMHSDQVRGFVFDVTDGSLREVS